MRCILTVLLLCITLACPLVPVRAADNPFLDLVNGSTIYFPHIAVSDDDSHWDTEIAIINTADHSTAGILFCYDRTGQELNENRRTINLALHGRYQADIREEFANAAKIAYMVYSSPTPGAMGYTKFYRAGMRASIAASTPRTSGVFSKIIFQNQNWTGIAFINADEEEATVTLTAYDDLGREKGSESLTVKGGEKIVNPVEEIFSEALELDQATYLVFTSDKPVVGFFLNGDASVLDGLPAL